MPVDGRKRYGFTLIELLVCFALLTIFGSIACFQGARALQDFRFKRAVKSLQEELKFAKQISLFSKSDICFILSWEKGRLVGFYSLDNTDNPLLKKKHYFEGVHSITINGKAIEDTTCFTFSSTDRSSLQNMQICLASANSEPVCIDFLRLG